MINCPHSIRVKRGGREWLECNIKSDILNKQICVFQRYCRTEGKIVHSNEALNCLLRIQGEDNG